MDSGKGEINLYPLGVPSFHPKPWVKRPCLRGVTKRSNMYLKPFGAPNEWLFSPLLRANISVSRGANPSNKPRMSKRTTYPLHRARCFPLQHLPGKGSSGLSRALHSGVSNNVAGCRWASPGTTTTWYFGHKLRPRPPPVVRRKKWPRKHLEASDFKALR